MNEEEFTTFELALQDALPHLNDPAFEPPGPVQHVLQAPTIDQVRRRIVEAVESMKPAADVPSNTRAWRLYQLLAGRYLQGLTQKETALQLGITARHLRREQQAAVHLLAQRLWRTKTASQDNSELDPSAAALASPPQNVETTTPAARLPTATGDETQDPSEWRSQVQEELQRLHEQAPGLVTDLRSGIDKALQLGAALTAGTQIQLQAAEMPYEIPARVHPSVLRQVLITAVEKLVHHLRTNGRIRISGRLVANRALLELSGAPLTTAELPDSEFIREILQTQSDGLEITRQNETVLIRLSLPAVQKIRVLVVDDNLDLVHFYRRYTAETRFSIVHVAHGRELFQKIEEVAPAVIVLDVMLPDRDGWDLLMEIQRHPLASRIPIIVCSVVRREELARTLGAALHLTKPVRRSEFLAALEQVVGQE